VFLQCSSAPSATCRSTLARECESKLCSTQIHFISRCLLFAAWFCLVPAVLTLGATDAQPSRTANNATSAHDHPCYEHASSRQHFVKGRRQGGEIPPGEKRAGAVKTTPRVRRRNVSCEATSCFQNLVQRRAKRQTRNSQVTQLFRIEFRRLRCLL